MAIFPDCAEPGPSVVSCRPEDGIRDRRRGGSLSAAWRASTGRRSPADPMSRAMRSSSAGRDVRCFCVTDDLFGAPFLRRRAGMRGGADRALPVWPREDGRPSVPDAAFGILPAVGATAA